MKTTLKIVLSSLVLIIGIGISWTASAATLQFENVAQPGPYLYGPRIFVHRIRLRFAGPCFSLLGSCFAFVLTSVVVWPTSNSDFFSTLASYTVTLTNQQNSVFSLNSIDVGAALPAYRQRQFCWRHGSIPGDNEPINLIYVQYSAHRSIMAYIKFCECPQFSKLKKFEYSFHTTKRQFVFFGAG